MNKAAWFYGMAWGWLAGYCIYLWLFTPCREGLGPVVNLVASLVFAIPAIIYTIKGK